jgi:hypothetical protein
VRSQVPWRRILLLFLASRLALEVVGLVSFSLLPHRVGHRNLVHHQPTTPAAEIWVRWDAEWYLLIAERGYDVRSYLAQLHPEVDAAGAEGFLPLYPALISLLTPVTGAVGAGILISNLSLLAALVLLFLVTADAAGAGVDGELAGLVACVALLLHPMSLFLSAVYAESLLLALSLGAYLAARRHRFVAAGALAGLAALTRPFGVLLVVPLALEWWASRHEPRGTMAARWGWLAACVPPAAFAWWLTFSARNLGGPLALLERQSRWRGGTSGPWRAFVRWWESGPALHGAHDSTLELVIALVCLASLWAVFRWQRRSAAAFALVALLIPLCSTLWSFGRLSLTVFPLFTAAGLAWARGARTVPVLLAFVGGSLGVLLTTFYATWWWAG